MLDTVCLIQCSLIWIHVSAKISNPNPQNPMVAHITITTGINSDMDECHLRTKDESFNPPEFK